MTDIFRNGGAGSEYTGLVFTTVTDVLNEMKTTLPGSLGWTIELDDIATNKKLILSGTYPGTSHKCYVVMQEVDNPAATNTKWLRINGSDDALETNLSPNFDHDFVEGLDNQFWLAANEFAFCLGIRSALGTFKPFHFGYPQHIAIADDPYPEGAYYIGWIDNTLLGAYACKAAHDGTLWKNIGDDYNKTDDFNSSSNTAPFQGVFDKRTVSHNAYSYYEFQTDLNAGRYAYNGAVNALNSKPVIDGEGSYWYSEGKGATNAYTLPAPDLASPLYYRGYICFAVTGLASLLTATQAEDEQSRRFITGEVGVQGFRIV